MQIWPLVSETWRNIPSAVKTIAIAAIGTMIGAWLTSRAQTKRRLLDELKAVRAARALCFSVTNKALAMKRQHVRPTKERFDTAVTVYRQHQTNPSGPLILSLDLQTLSQVKFPGDVLERIAFEKCSLDTEALATVVALSAALDDLKNSIDLRNDLIKEFREKQPMPERDKIEFYTGAATTGIIDTRFANNVEALLHQVDDCIFFSMRLTDMLSTNGNATLRRYRWQFNLRIPKFFPADWSIAKEANLIPPDSQYVDWLKGFRPAPTRWQQFRGWVKRSPASQAGAVAETNAERLSRALETTPRRGRQG